MLTLLGFDECLKIAKMVCKSSACPVGAFSPRPIYPKCDIWQKSKKKCFTNKIEHPLELRLAEEFRILMEFCTFLCCFMGEVLAEDG